LFNYKPGISKTTAAGITTFYILH